VRQHDLSFANFVVRFGMDDVLLNYAADIVIPAFTRKDLVRSYGETTFRFFNVTLDQVGNDEDGVPVLALSGHFIKDTVLRRTQIFTPSKGLVEDEAAMESAPSSYFILILNNHRLLYFPETASAPPLDAFRTTAQYAMRAQWHDYIRARQQHVNVTRRGTERVTIPQLQKQLPPPFVTVVRVAGQDAITDTIDRFRKIKQIRLRLVQPNDEIDASAAVAAVEQTLRPLEPKRLEVIASGPKGLNKKEAKKVVGDASEGQNTDIIVDGEDDAGLPLKVENEDFALSVPIDDPPADDKKLRARLMKAYRALAEAGKVKRLATPAHFVAAILNLLPKQ
jgi:hypothetical protein